MDFGPVLLRAASASTSTGLLPASSSGRTKTETSVVCENNPEKRNNFSSELNPSEKWRKIPSSPGQGRQNNFSDPDYDNLDNIFAARIFRNRGEPAGGKEAENNLTGLRPTTKDTCLTEKKTIPTGPEQNVPANQVNCAIHSTLKRNSLISNNFPNPDRTFSTTKSSKDRPLSQTFAPSRKVAGFSVNSAPNTPVLRITAAPKNVAVSEKSTFVARPYRRAGSDSDLKCHRIRRPAPEIQTPAVCNKAPDFLSRSSAKLKRVFSKGKMDAPSSKKSEESTEISTNNDVLTKRQTSRNISVADPMQRVSFTSTSTGYSSARSSLRSSVPYSADNPPFSGNGNGSYSSNGLLSPLLKENESLSASKKASFVRGNAEPSYLDRIAMELLDTERVYVNDLDSVIQGYLNFLLSQRDELGVTAVDICQLFGNVEQVFEFNRQFYLILDACRLDLLRMAQCFVDQESGFEVYAEYCTQYPKMVAALNRLCQKQRIREILRERQMGLNHSLPLGPYLLKPVQRVLKYHLFLQNTLKHWDHSKTAELRSIQRALDCMTGRAQHINDVKKRQEHAIRVQEIQRTLLSWKNEECDDLTQYGDLVLEDCFRVSGSKATRRVFLFEEMLLITKDKADAQLICKDFIMCSSLMLVESVSGDPLSFQVLSFDNPKLQHTLQARNPDQKCHWMQEVKRVMLDHFSAEIPSRAKEILMEMSAKKSEECCDSGKVGGAKRQHPVPKYLEKRRKSAEPSNDIRIIRKSKNCSRSASVTDLVEKQRNSFACDSTNISESVPTEPTPSANPSSEQKRNHQIRVQQFFEHRKFSTDTRAPSCTSMTSRFIPQRLRRSKSPSVTRQPVKIRSVTRLDSNRRHNQSAHSAGPSHAHSAAKRLQSAPVAAPVEVKFFEASEFPSACAQEQKSIKNNEKIYRTSTGSSEDSAYGSRTNENSARNSDTSSDGSKNEHVTSWLYSCGFEDARNRNSLLDQYKNIKGTTEARKSGPKVEQKTEEIEKAYAHLWEELKEFCTEESAKITSPKKSSVATKFPIVENASIVEENRQKATEIGETPVNRLVMRSKTRSQSREGSTDSRTMDAINRLTDLLKIDNRSIEKKPIELGSKLERIRPARPEKVEEKSENLKKAKSLGSLLTPRESSTPVGSNLNSRQNLFDDQDTCSTVSSRESLYDTVFEWNLERQLDVLHAWDSEMLAGSQEWSDWLTGGNLTNQEFLEAELQPLRACVDIRKSVRQWEDRMKGSQCSLGEDGDSQSTTKEAEPNRVKSMARQWGRKRATFQF